MAEPDYKAILLSLIASLCLCDNMGDVGSDISEALKQAGMPMEWDDESDLLSQLGKMDIKTLYGTDVGTSSRIEGVDLLTILGYAE